MKSKYKKDITHFGFQNVQVNKKASLVANVFDTVATKYDVMNDIMSFGIHRFWKQFLIDHSEVYDGCRVLDLAGGTGDLSIKFVKLIGDTGIVVLLDINVAMLKIGRDRLRNLGILNNVLYIQADAESLPFADNTFHCIAVSFGLRNFTNKIKALNSMYRVLKPGGKLLILDFGVPKSKLMAVLYNFYSFNVIPKLGKLIANDYNSYRYLIESIRMHPDQDTLKDMISNVGFCNVEYFNMTNGIVVLHCAYKF